MLESFLSSLTITRWCTMTQDATSQRLKVISRVTRLSKATSPCTASVVPTLGAAVFIPNVLKNVQLLRKTGFKTSKQLPTWWSGTCGLIDNILQPARDSDGSFLEILWPLTSFCDGKRRFYTTWITGTKQETYKPRNYELQCPVLKGSTLWAT